MAVRFTRASTQYLTYGAAPNYNGAYSVLVRSRVAVTNVTQTVVAVQVNVNNYDVMWHSSATLRWQLRCVVAGAATDNGDQTANTLANTWYYLAMVRTSATALQLWTGTSPEGIALQSTGTRDVTGRTAATAVQVGSFNNGSNLLDGREHGLLIYDGLALSSDELKTAFAMLRPPSMGNVWGWFPLLEAGDYKDYTGQRAAPTVTGTPTTEDNSPTPWGKPNLIVPFAVTGGGGVQTISPNATVAAGGWTDHLGGTTDLHSPLADESASTYDQSPINPTNATLKLGLTDIGTPASGDITFEIDAEQI